MQVRFYCDLYISESCENKKSKLIRRAKMNRLRPYEYVIALAQGPQNNLDIIPGILFRQHVFDHSEVFVIGFAGSYDDALELTRKIAEEVYEETGSADIRKFITEHQNAYDSTGR